MDKHRLIKYLHAQGFSDKIVESFRRVNRENFIPEHLREYAYENKPLPIGEGQTISQPYTIAFMLKLLELKDRQKILEVGSGSGYVLALISEISDNSEIYGIERIKELADKSRENLKNRKNIEVICADGSLGLKQKAPFDRILVSASARQIPQKLIEQLKIDGILVSCVNYSIVYVKKTSEGNEIKEFPGFIFVPLVEDWGE